MKVRIISMILISIFLSGLLQAQGPHRDAQRMRQGLRGMEIPDLTEDQEQKIDEIHNNMKKASLPLKSEIEVAAAELKQMMIVEKPDRIAILKKVDTISDLRANLQKLHVESQLKIRELLTVTQRVVFDQKILEGRGHSMSHERSETRPVMPNMRGRSHAHQAREKREAMESDLEVIEEE